MASIYNNGETLLVGTAGNDWFLDDSGGGQTMVGGLGNDVYEVDSTDDFLIEAAGGGIDTVLLYNYSSDDDYTLAANVDNLTVYGYANHDFAGNADANVIDISSANGSDGYLYGLGGNDTLIGGSGSDWLEGGAGSDRMVGGWGDDRYYVQDVGDLVIEVTDNTATTSINEEQGEDTVYSDITYIAPNGVENVVLWGKGPWTFGEDGWENGSLSTAAINATGNALDNDLVGNNGNNVLTGLGGSDDLSGEDGNDILAGGAGEDFLDGGAGNDNLDGGDGEDFLNGGDGNDVLLGGNGEDFFFGGYGNDRLDGGADDDRLIDFSGGEGGVNDTLLGGTGNDFLFSGIGADRLDGGTGNDFLMEMGEDGETNVLLGGDGNDAIVVIDNNGANTLDGGVGNDVFVIGNSGEDFFFPVGMGEDNFAGFVLNGGAGDDSYFILGHESAEKVTVLDSAGNDTIYLVNGEDSVREILGNDLAGGEDPGQVTGEDMMHIFTMAAGIENLYADGLNDGEDSNGQNAMYLIGNAIDNRMVGTDDRDVLIGLAGNDTLEGGAGADDMVGGAGNDLYIIGDYWSSGSNSAHDTVVEAANEGTDTVWAYESYKLENNVEHLRLFGWENLKGTGNALDNSLTGNNGENTLSGGIGNDVLDGGAGDDRLYGGTGVDRLDGGSGADFMNGGVGNDTYFVDHDYDTVFEFSDGQIGNDGGTADNVFSSVNFWLGANIENLTLTGSGDIGGDGNDDSNVIVGNGGNNWLMDGSTGWGPYLEEVTITGGGKDTLIGGAGNDSYYVNWDGSGIDVITDSGGTNDSVGLYVGADFDNRDVLTLGAGNLLGIEHLTISGDYDGVGAGPTNTDASGFTITGSAVENSISGSNVGDTISGGVGNDHLWGQNGADVLRGDVGDDWLYAGATTSEDDAVGDTLDGGAGNDTLDSGDDGADRLIGGDGNDLYFIGNSTLTSNTFVESSLAAGGSNDVIEAYGQDIDLTGTNIEGAVVKGYGDENTWTATGTSVANFFRVLGVNDSGYLYSDDVTLIGGAGNDFYLIEQGSYGANQNLGFDWDNNQHIFILETTAGGTDTLRTYADVADYNNGITLADNVENMVLAASHESNGYFNYGATSGIGNAGNNTITGNAGDNDDGSYNGSAYTNWYGNSLSGGGGNDVLLGDKGDDWLDGDYYGNTTLIGTTDRMVGGKGDDDYVVNSTGDVVVELANEGDDWVGVDNRNGAFTYTLALNNVEDASLLDTGTMGGGIVGNLLDNDLASYGSGSATLDGGAGNDSLAGGSGNDTLLGGIGNDQLYGNDGNDALNGGAGNDWLYGGSGGDTLIGGDGNDGYSVDSTADVVTEGTAAIGGIDWVDTNGLGAYTLGAGVENLFMYNGGSAVMAVGNGLNNEIEIETGSFITNTLSGLGGNDTLYGSSGSDWLDGGTGNDWMFGSDGYDHYTVDSTADFAMEAGNEGGVDYVTAIGTSFNLATNGWNVENLSFAGVTTGPALAFGIGNELNNIISAESVTNSRNFFLQGGGGNDQLWGGTGNDILDGGAGNDLLAGGEGSDDMTGGMGDDTYYVAAGDEVFEAPGNGFDTINSEVSFTNVSGVEVLQLFEGFTAAISATGLDTQADTLIGNSENNTLAGGEGNDWLIGNNGDDLLIGGDGLDTFVFQQQASVDTIDDFVDGEDLIAIDDGVFTSLLGYSSGQALSSGDFTTYNGSFWVNAGAEIGYNSVDGALYYSALGDGTDALQIGTVEDFATVTITEADFIVI